ncbi:MAG: AMP-binding protein [Desulfobacteraceae bacterium]|jgi:long-chain acyl-CoA synthetase
MGLYDFTLYDVIVRNSRVYANRPAWFEPDRPDALTFSQIRQLVDGLAARLQQAKCKRGDRIGVVGKNCLEFFLLYGAAAALGAIVLPVNWRLSVDEAVYVLNDGSPRLVFSDDDNLEWTREIRNRLPDTVRFFNLRPHRGPFEEIGDLAEAAEGFISPEVRAEDGFVIIHTAAVGGHPRGALLSQNNLLCCHLQMMHGLALTGDDVHLNVLPLFHVAGLFTVFCAFHAGCLNINVPRFDPVQAVELITNKKVSLMFTFAPILKSILEQQAEEEADIGSLRAVLGLEAPDTITRYQQISGGTFYTMFGQTETSMLATFGAYNDCPGAAGTPIAMATVALLNDADRPVAQTEIGEIAIRGPMVFKGYWRLDEDNAKTFRNGWHHTGDLGRMDENGYLWYEGRKADKELIKPGGENVYPAEVEQVILEHPAVEAVVVFGVPDPKWKEGIKAVCALKSGQTLESTELIEFVGSRIARYKKPQYVEFVDALPKRSDGDVDRGKVKEMYGA